MDNFSSDICKSNIQLELVFLPRHSRLHLHMHCPQAAAPQPAQPSRSARDDQVSHQLPPISTASHTGRSLAFLPSRSPIPDQILIYSHRSPPQIPHMAGLTGQTRILPERTLSRPASRSWLAGIRILLCGIMLGDEIMHVDC